jgi:hypothetical protein
MIELLFACCIQLEPGILAYTKVMPTTSSVRQSSIVVHSCMPMNNVYVLSKLSSHQYQLVRKLFVIRTPLNDYVEQ